MMWRKEIFRILGGVALACLVASSAQAVLITTSGVWDNPDPSSGPVFDTINGVGTNEISWGEPRTDDNQSSYVFTGVNSNIPNPLNGDPFSLGTFTHNNFTIALSTSQFLGADLTVTISAPGIGVSHVFGPFEFDHEETPNSPPCAYIGSPDCPDKVTIPLATEGVPFTFMGAHYLFFLDGFRASPGSPIIPEFVTNENQANNATLFAHIQLVPEPTTIMLLGLGLLGLGVIARRKKS